MRNRLFFGMVLILLLDIRGHGQSGKAVYRDSSFVNTVLKEHNNYRAELQLPALVWSASLAEDAQKWASHLADIDKGQHDMSQRGKEGENIWWGTAGAYGPAEMVDFWAGEKKDFVYGIFPDVTRSKSAVVGHYTQMVWKATTSVGCALVGNGKKDYLVCRYASPGNIIGQKPY